MNETLAHAAPQPAGARRPGRIEKALLRWLMRPATVAAVEQLSDRFRLIDLEGEALRGVAWRPGDKVQVMLGGLRTARTYTPVLWDGNRGRTRLVAFSHGTGPGSAWAQALKPGDSCEFFGPRRSLDFGSEGPPLALFGDETSLGLVLALAGAGRIASSPPILEVASEADTAPVLDRLDLASVMLVERAADDGHLDAVGDHLAESARGGWDVVLTGRAPAIQRLSPGLKGAGIPASRIKAKAYWAPGKVGLD